MTEIIPGIYHLRIPIPNNPLGYTNAYLVKGKDECLLIDPGMDTQEAFDTLEKELSQAGVGFENITRVICTHGHGDHYGLSRRVKELSRAEILLHHLEGQATQHTVRDMDNYFRHLEEWLYRNGVPKNGLPEPRVRSAQARRSDPLTPDILLKGDETISIGPFKLQVLWTPGHSPGHICLYEPTEKVLFAGDHVLPVITPNISVHSESEGNPLGNFLNSLEKVKHLDVKVVLPGHERIFTDLAKRVEQIIQHHERRSSDIIATIKTEPKTAYQISSEIRWMLDFGGVKFQDLTPWDKRMAVTESLSHLEALRANGKVSKSSRDNVFYYGRN